MENRKALKFLHEAEIIGDIVEITGIDSSDLQFLKLETLITHIMIDFGWEMCELQKKECADNATNKIYELWWETDDNGNSLKDINIGTLEIDELLPDINSILNTKNICE